MFPALYVAEIARLVCENADKPTLASLAVCCKALYQEAMPALWGNLDSLAPLVKSLPRDAWMIEKDLLKITRRLVRSDWDVFLKLATFVRAVIRTHSSDAPVLLHQGVIPALAAHRPQLILFPNLRSLGQAALFYSHDHVHEFLTMVGPKLTHLSMESSGSPAALLQSLVVASDFTRIQNLAVGTSALEEDMEDMPKPLFLSSVWLTSCPLTRFKCEELALSELSIRALSTLSTLENLSVRLPQEGVFTHIDSARSPFALLQELEIFATAKAYVSFANAVGVFPRVNNFALYVVKEPISNVSPRNLVAAIASSLVPEVLTNLAVSMHDEDEPEQSDDEPMDEEFIPFSSEDFRPLLKFYRMADMEFAQPWVFDFQDDFIAEVAKAWPELVYFNLGVKPYCKWAPPPRGLTLKALPPFAMHCPWLHELGLQFNATPGPTDHGRIAPDSDLYGELRKKASSSSSFLRKMHVATSPISHTAEVASFLSCVFPTLDDVKTGAFSPADGEEAAFAKRWRELSRYMPAFQAIRKNERARIRFAWSDD